MRNLGRRLSAVGLAIVLSLLCVGCLMSTPDYIEVTTEESTFDNRYYYSCLSETEQALYREIYQGLSEQSDSFTVHCTDGDEANRIFYIVLMDFPELFWPDGNIVSTAYNDTYTIVEAAYNCTEEERLIKQGEIETEAAAIVGSVPAEYGEYEKIKYIYEYLVNSVEYVKDAPDNQNMYSAIVGKKSVCAGYAKANQYLLNRLGIFCTYVLGDATTEESTDAHAWNIVRCNEKYYYVDVTWGDPLFNADSEVQDTDMVYDYLCCDETTLSATHTADIKYTYPVCDSDDLNYYRLNNMFYDSADRAALRNAMYRSIDAQEAKTTLKFSNADVYQQARDLIINSLLSDATQYLGRNYRLREVTCYYAEDEPLNKFIIYWNYQ